MKSAKQIKKEISKVMTDRKNGISVSLGECDNQMERILIHFDKNFDYVFLFPIKTILEKSGFFIAQVVSFWKDEKLSILLIRELKVKKC